MATHDQESTTPQSGFSTRAIRGQMERTAYREHSAPVFMTSSFVFPSAESMAATFSGEEEGIIYSRYNNPGVDEFVAKVCAMEGAEAGFATASGMAAVFAGMLPFLRQGDHVLASRALFGSTHQILTQLFPRWGITHTYVDAADVDSWEAAVQDNTRLLFVETPSNPGLALVDLEAAGALARRHGLIFVVDNCFATPYLQQPLAYGAHLSVHSATKWMDGQGRTLGGIVVGSAELMEPIIFFCRHTGPAMSPFNAWVLSKSLETLELRMDRHCDNALALARWLEQQPGVARVHYPFLPSHPQQALAQRQMKQGGGIVSIELAGGAPAAFRLMNALQLCSRTSNLGDSRTTVTHPASSTHAKLTEAERQAVGIAPGLLRISVGLEAVKDVMMDLQRGLER